MAYTPKLTYKGRPLVRCGNEIYYGSLADPYVVFMQVLTTKEENGITVAVHRPGSGRHVAGAGPERGSGRREKVSFGAKKPRTLVFFKVRGFSLAFTGEGRGRRCGRPAGKPACICPDSSAAPA